MTIIIDFRESCFSGMKGGSYIRGNEKWVIDVMLFIEILFVILKKLRVLFEKVKVI